MNKYIRFGVPIIISLTLLLGVVVRAEENGSNNGDSATSAQGEVHVGVKDQFKNIKNDREEIKTRLQTVIGDIKTKREQFKNELSANKELVKQKIETTKAEFQAKLAKIKDLKKKSSTENIVTKITELNTKITDQLSKKIDQIENVLVSVNSRISKAETKGIDTTTAKAQAVKAQAAIDAARVVLGVQSKKTYTPTTIDETKLRTEMQTLRDSFKTDIKAAYATVKLAHQAVRNTATTLAKIPKIDEDIDNGDTPVLPITPGTPASSTN